MYKIITDSCCDLPYEIMKREIIDFISMEVIINDEIFHDDFGKTFNMEYLYKKMKQGTIPTTSQINISRYIEFFRPYVEENIPVIYICFSSGLSGSYENALKAVEFIKKDFPEANLYIFDSLSASGGQGLMVLDALANLKNGMSFKENIDWLEKNKSKYQHWVFVNDLEYLYHGGRLNKSAVIIGDLLNIKPILTIDTFGKLIVDSKVRTWNRGLTSIGDKIIQALNSNYSDNIQKVIITTSGNLPLAKKLKNYILNETNSTEILITEIGATITSHTGLGCVAAFVKEY